MKISIRKAQAADAAAARDIRNAAILRQCPAHYPADLLAIWTSEGVTDEWVQFVVQRVYLATVGDEVVGTGAVDLESGQLDALFIRPDMMRRGIGRQMVDHLESLALAAGLTRLTLNSTLNAAPFYRRCGFVGETVSTYHSPRGITLDCIPMVKELVSAGWHR